MNSKNAHVCAQNTRNGIGFHFFRVIPQRSKEFLNHIVRVIGDESWVSFVNVETKEQSKQWMHTYSPNKPKMSKQMSARKLMAAVCCNRIILAMMEFMQQGTTVTSEVNCETLKTL
jgi:hypothetical protein